MFERHYQQELQNLRELAAEFSKVHPAIAPMLSGPSADPDVERILEGVAFLCGLLNKKLEDEFPEIIHGLLEIVFPHYIRPIPSASIVQFHPKPSLRETTRVPKGISLASVPVDGTSCIFKTCFDLEVHPLRLRAADCISGGRSARIRMELELTGPSLSQWNPGRLGFFIGGSLSQATDIFMLLRRHLQWISLTPLDDEEGLPCILKPDCLNPVGFDIRNDLLLFPPQAFSGYRLLHEYFLLPHKFLFMELTGWEQWKKRGEGHVFEIAFEIDLPETVHPPRVTADEILLNATPVINLFRHDADPFVYEHKMEKVRIRPSAQNRDHYRVFSVESVSGYGQGSVSKKEYSPMELFHRMGEGASYQVIRSRSPVNNQSEVYLSFSYPPGSGEPGRETIAVELICTNGELPEKLRAGDICNPTSDSPELLTFSNVIPPTSQIEPPLGGDIPWRFLSHLLLNFFPLADQESLKRILQLYVFPESRDRAKIAANLKRIDGILKLEQAETERLSRGCIMKGRDILVTMRQDHFAGPGDLYLFGSVLDLFLGVYAGMNSFIRFRLKESLSGELFTWPMRIGNRLLS